MDLIIGTDFDPSSFPWTGKLMLFENIGLDNNNEPNWSLIDSEYLGNELGNNLSPSIVDIDADGDLDLFVGNFNGTLQFFENTGNLNSPEYSFIEYIPNIDLAGYSTPEFVDIDNDNDFDLLIGNMDGNIFLYENIGNASNYNFQYSTDSFANINVSFRSSPLCYDFDQDGDEDLFVGSGINDLIFYENIGDANNDSYILNENLSIYNLGKNISPSIFLGANEKGLVTGLSTGGMYFIPQCGLDFNNDNSIDVIDVVLLIVHILDTYNNNLDENCLDLNEDLDVDILDVIQLINYILNI